MCEFTVLVFQLFSLLSGTVCIAMLTVKSFREEVISTLYERAKEYYTEYDKDGISNYYSEMSREEYETTLMFWIKVYIGIAALVFFFCIMTFHGVLTVSTSKQTMICYQLVMDKMGLQLLLGIFKLFLIIVHVY
jgi:hypothetical protein